MADHGRSWLCLGLRTRLAAAWKQLWLAVASMQPWGNWEGRLLLGAGWLLWLLHTRWLLLVLLHTEWLLYAGQQHRLLHRTAPCWLHWL